MIKIDTPLNLLNTKGSWAGVAFKEDLLSIKSFTEGLEKYAGYYQHVNSILRDGWIESCTEHDKSERSEINRKVMYECSQFFRMIIGEDVLQLLKAKLDAKLDKAMFVKKSGVIDLLDKIHPLYLMFFDLFFKSDKEVNLNEFAESIERFNDTIKDGVHSEYDIRPFVYESLKWKEKSEKDLYDEVMYNGFKLSYCRDNII